MGLRDDNLYSVIHRQVGWPGFRRELRWHREEAGIDHTVVIPQAAWGETLLAAQTGDSAFFQTLQGLPGGAEIVVDLPSACLSTLRQLVLDLDAH